MNERELFARLVGGQLANVRFADMRRLIEAFGFVLVRVKGSHHIFSRTNIPELLNLQEVKSEAKPYQIRQFLRMVERYDLVLENDQ